MKKDKQYQEALDRLFDCTEPMDTNYYDKQVDDTHTLTDALYELKALRSALKDTIEHATNLFAFQSEKEEIYFRKWAKKYADLYDETD